MPHRADFASDNTAGAAPEAMAALIEANSGFARSYGEDAVCARAGELIRALLDVDAPVHFVASGTAANAVALAAICRPFEAVLAHEHAHIMVNEVAAPSLFGGGLSLVGLPGASGRIDPSALAAALAEPESAHHPSPAALSLTNVTEYFSLYSLEAVRALAGAARERGLKTHLDGARLAMAAAAGFDLKGLRSADVDVLVLGGTKAGMTPTEAIVLFDRSLERRFDTRLKQGGQLPSKSRFLAAPWIGMLESGAFVERARHAGRMAQRLAAAQPFEVAHPVDANAIFLRMEPAALARLHAAGWETDQASDGSVRLACSWATTEALVDELAEALHAVA
jgi:threonine aldolase